MVCMPYTGANIRGSCSRALDAVRSFRNRLGGAATLNDITADQKANFGPYKQPKGKGPAKRSKGISWTVKMVCLSSTNAKRVPCTVVEREALIEAGLGEKKVFIEDINCSHEEFKSAIIATFPKLGECGGFDLLRCIPNTKELEVISLAISQSPKLLKSVVACGRVFIRPIQKNLAPDPDKELTSPVQVCLNIYCRSHCMIPSMTRAFGVSISLFVIQLNEKCIYSGEEVALTHLRKHVQCCRFDTCI